MKQGSIHGDQIVYSPLKVFQHVKKFVFCFFLFYIFICIFKYLLALYIFYYSFYFLESYYLVYTLSIQLKKKKNHATCIPDIPIQILPTSLTSYETPGNSFSLTDFSVLICVNRGFESTIFLSLPEPKWLLHVSLQSTLMLK